MSFNEYIDLFGNNIIYLFEQHLMLFALALLGAAVLGIGLGVLTHRFQPLARLAVPLINVLQACQEQYTGVWKAVKVQPVNWVCLIGPVKV